MKVLIKRSKQPAEEIEVPDDKWYSVPVGRIHKYGDELLKFMCYAPNSNYTEAWFEPAVPFDLGAHLGKKNPEDDHACRQRQDEPDDAAQASKDDPKVVRVWTYKPSTENTVPAGIRLKNGLCLNCWIAPLFENSDILVLSADDYEIAHRTLGKTFRYKFGAVTCAHVLEQL